MKICVVGPAYPFRGGIAHHTTLLCRHLAEKHDVDAAVFKRLYPSILFPGRSQLDPSLQPRAFHPLPMIDSLNPRTWADTGNFVSDLGVDWVLIQWWQPFFGPCLASIASRARKRSKVGFICHNVLPHERMPLGRALTLWALKHGDGFIVHSGQDMQDLRGLFPGMSPQAVRKTIHPECDLFPVAGMTRQQAREKLGVEGNVLLFFGLVRKYKGLMDLIEAMSYVKTRDITCLVVGEFYEKREKYTQRIDRLRLGGRIRITDSYVPNEDVEPYFAAADAIVLPYRSATQSGIVQMAFRFGRPVISTAVGGLPEAVDDNRTGLLVPPADPQALAYAIDRFFSDSMSPSLEEAIREERERFSWDRVIETIESMDEAA